jgi:DNA repair protein RecO (recombination protein O)
LRGEGDILIGDILEGLKLTGYFLERHVFGPRAIAMPQARQWLADGLKERSLAC